MKRTMLLLCAWALLPGCAQDPYAPERSAHAANMRTAEDIYVACLNAAAEKQGANPARAEDIALAAHGGCWAEWSRYREATFKSFSANASTPDERQFARDKADAYLREFEREARTGVVDRIVERNLPQARP